MTEELRGKIYGHGFEHYGFIEYDPRDYEYTGPDPDDGIVTLLENHKQGNLVWPDDAGGWHNELEESFNEQHIATKTLVMVGHRLTGHDPIAGIMWNDSFPFSNG